MLLVIDIGNSNIEFGVFKGKKLVDKRSMPTDEVYSFGKCSAVIYKLPYRSQIKDIVVSSVVPDALGGISRALKRVFKKDILVIGKDLEAPIKNLYSKPEQVGQDRLLNAVAVSGIYNRGKKKKVVVIDFGTAVTFDLISKKGEYLGGIIFPGIRLSLENLSKRAALLPKIELKKPRSLIGKNTKDSMRSGILNGYASLCDGIIDRVKALYKERPRIIATGGDAALIAGYTKSIKTIDPDLTLKGLEIAFEAYSRGGG